MQKDHVCRQTGFIIQTVIVTALIIVVVVVTITLIAVGSLHLNKSNISKVLPPTPDKTITEAPKFELGTITVKFKLGISVNSNVPPGQATNSKSINQLLEKIQAKEIKSVFYEENPPLYGSGSASKDTNLERVYSIYFNPDLDVEQIAAEFKVDPGVEDATPKGYVFLIQ